MTKFEKISKYADVDFLLPTRKTSGSAGYDFTAVEDTIIPSHYLQLIKMIIKKFSSPDFITKLSELEVVEILAEASTTLGSMNEKQKQKFATELISNYGKELLEFLQSEATLDLSDMKQLTKDSKTKMSLVPTGVKVKLEKNQKLELLIRSSSPLHSYLLMANSIGLIDSDYYNNEDNEGHIFFQIINMSPFNIRIKKGDIIGQGVISTYDKTIDDIATETRKGGLGSTTAQK